jgi:outer membrane protein
MKRLIITLFVSIVVQSVTAQEASSQERSPVLTFEEAVSIGLKKNILLNTQKNNLYLAEARKAQGIANFLPSISGQASAQRGNGLTIDPTTGVGSNITSDNIYAAVNANLTLFNGFNRINVLKQAAYAEDAQIAFIGRTEQDVVYNVSLQYLQVLLDQELLRIAEETFKAQAALRDQIRGMADVGSRAELDFFTQDAIVKNLEVTAIRAKVTLMNDRALLSQTLQLDPIDTFQVAKPQWQAATEDLSASSLDSLVKVALASRKDLQQQELLVNSWKYSMRGNAGGYFPTLSAFAGYQSTYFKSSNNPNPDSFSSQFYKLNPQTAYGLALRVPIFSQLQTRTNRITQKVQMLNTALLRDNLEKTIKIDVQRAFKNYNAAILAYKASLRQFEAADYALKLQKESYDLGSASQVAVSQATQTYIQGVASKAQAENTLLFQRVLLDYAMGVLNPADYSK